MPEIEEKVLCRSRPPNLVPDKVKGPWQKVPYCTLPFDDPHDVCTFSGLSFWRRPRLSCKDTPGPEPDMNRT